MKGVLVSLQNKHFFIFLSQIVLFNIKVICSFFTAAHNIDIIWRMISETSHCEFLVTVSFVMHC